MQVGQLMIDMAADMARLRTDMNTAVNTVDGAMKQIHSSISKAKTALEGLAAAFAVREFALFIKSSIDAADRMGKLAERTGLAVESLTGLQIAYRQAGLGVDALQPTMSRLNKAIAEGSNAFKAMGVDARNSDGSLRSTRDVLADVADKFAGYEDGAAKSALAMELFGKSGADMISVLNLGGEGLAALDAQAASLGLTIDKETTKKAAKFNDTLELLKQGAGGVGQKISAALLPTLTTMAGELLTSANDTGALTTASDALKVALKALYAVAGTGVQIFMTVGRYAGAAGAAIMALISGDFTGAKNIMKEASIDTADAWKKQMASIKNVWNETGSAAVEANAAIIGATRESAPVVEKLGHAAKEARDEFAELLNKLQSKEAGIDPDFLKNLNLLRDGYLKGRITLDQYNAAVLTLTKNQKGYTDAMKAEADAIKKVDDERKKLQKELDDQNKANQKLIDDAADMLDSIEFETKALKMNTREREVATAMRELERKGVVKGTEAYEEYAKKIREAVVDREAVRSSVEAQKQIAEQWQKTSDQISQSFTDALMNGGKSVAQYLKGLFRTLVLRPIIQPIVSGMVGALGSLLGGPAMAGQAGGGLLGGLGNISSLGSIGNMFGMGSVLGNFVPGLQAGFGALFGEAGIGGGLSAGFTALGAGNISGGLGTLLGVAGPLALAVPIIAALGSSLFGHTHAQHNLQGMFGGDAGFMGRYEDYYKGGLFSSSYSDYTPLDAGLQKALSDTWRAQEAAVMNYAQTLGLATDKIEGFSFYANLKLKDIKTDDPAQYQSEVMKLVNDAIRSGSNEMAQRLIGTLTDTGKTTTEYYIDEELGSRQKREVPVYDYTPSEYARDGEEAIDTLTRLATSLQAANAAFSTLGQTLLEGSLASGDMASSLMDLFGGIDNFNQVAAGYLQNYYTASEQLAVIRKQIQDTIEGAGGTMPGSRSQFRSMVDQAQADFAAGVEGAAELLAALMQVSDAFAQITPNLFQGGQDMANAITQGMLGTWDGDNLGTYLAQTVQDGIYNAIAGNFAGQITDIIVAGVIEPVISAAVTGSAISEAVSAESISAMVAQAQAVADAFAAVMNDPAFLQAIHDITAAVGKINIPTAHISSINSYTKAVSNSGAAAGTAANQVSNAWQQIADSLIEQVRRIRGEMADAGEQSLAYWESQFAINTAMARSGDQDAAGRLVGLSDSLLQAAQNQAGSMLELQQIRAAVAQSLQDTAGFAAGFAGNAAASSAASSQASAQAAYQAARNDPANWAMSVGTPGGGGSVPIYIGPAANSFTATPAAPVAMPAQMVVPQAIAPSSGPVTVSDPKVLEKLEQFRVEQQAQAAALAATQGVLVRFVRQVEAEGGMPPVRPDAPAAKVRVVA